MPRPLGIESKIKATVQFENIEFTLKRRYDRLELTDGNLELIDYKTNKHPMRDLNPRSKFNLES